MSRVKLVRFAANALRSDIVEPGKATYQNLRGRWNEAFFQADATTPITLEMGCGKGAYTVALAERTPAANFLGFDVKGERLHSGATQAEVLGLRNVGWLRGRAHELADHFAPGELAHIWITFPDPRPKLGDAKRRLTAPRYLALYQELLRPGGTIHFKTDDQDLFTYTLEESLPTLAGAREICFTRDLYGPDGAALLPRTHGIQTHYEQRFRAEGKPICYLELEI